MCPRPGAEQRVPQSGGLVPQSQIERRWDDDIGRQKLQVHGDVVLATGVSFGAGRVEEDLPAVTAHVEVAGPHGHPDAAGLEQTVLIHVEDVPALHHLRRAR